MCRSLCSEFHPQLAHPAGRGNQQLLREDGEQFQCHHPPQLAGLCAAPASSRAHCGCTGDTEYDALYDLLSCRFIIPIGAAWPLRVLSFLKLTFLEGISWKITRRLFHVDARSACEKKVIRLARQTPLSCAEIIKCIEMDIRRLKDGYDVLDKLYDDNDLNCDNFAQAVREYRCSHEVITAVANLYLRQQIMIDTY